METKLEKKHKNKTQKLKTVTGIEKIFKEYTPVLASYCYVPNIPKT